MATLKDLNIKEVVTLFEIIERTLEDGPGSNPAHGVEDPINRVFSSDSLWASRDSAIERLEELALTRVSQGFSEPNFSNREQTKVTDRGTDAQKCFYYRGSIKELAVDRSEIEDEGSCLRYEGRVIL